MTQKRRACYSRDNEECEDCSGYSVSGISCVNGVSFEFFASCTRMLVQPLKVLVQTDF